MVGDRLRELRIARNLALTDVAAQLHISVATLSRIERGKQNLDLGMFLQLAKVLGASPQEILEAHQDTHDGKDPVDPLVNRIASLNSSERARLWRNLAERNRTRATREAARRHVSQQVEELLAHVDFLRDEIDEVNRRIRKK